MSINTQVKRKNSIIITQITDHEYLLEGNFDLKLYCVIDPIISCADIIGGPIIQINRDFLGKGLVKNISIINNTKDNIIIKVSLYEEVDEK